LSRATKFIGADFAVALEPGRPSVIDRVVVNHWAKTDDEDAVWRRGVELMRDHAESSFEDLLAAHTAAWQRVWDVLDIEIEGDPVVLQGLRFSSFQTYQSYHGEDENLNALCKGMTAEVYFGWVYWDSEIYSHRLMMFIDRRLPEAAPVPVQPIGQGARAGPGAGL